MEQWTIIHEDGELLVADKLAPIPVQPEKSGDPSLQDLLRAGLPAPAEGKAFLEAAHRIDRRASGAVIFAKTQRALETLEADFRARRIGKRYIVCVETEPEPASGTLENRLLWDKRTNRVRALPKDFVATKGSTVEEARLEYRLAGRSERYFFLEIELLTGKHHQIRAQLGAAGWPIRGDVKYGARRTTRNGLIMLHARRLEFIQPRGRETLTLLAPFPESEPLWAAFTPE